MIFLDSGNTTSYMQNIIISIVNILYQIVHIFFNFTMEFLQRIFGRLLLYSFADRKISDFDAKREAVLDYVFDRTSLC